jgi:hypothetical protein
MENYPKYTPKLKVWAKNCLFYQKEGAKYRMTGFRSLSYPED